MSTLPSTHLHHTAHSDLDWSNIGFNYHNLPYRYRAYYKNGEWYEGGLETDANITLNEAAVVFHYGQAIFEGMKAYRRKDGGINLFRPYENAKRLNKSAERLMMPGFPEEDFVLAVKELVKANQEFVPEYGTGASLYIRPFMIAAGAQTGVSPANEYIFAIYATPVGAYYKNGLQPTKYITSEFDRAAHGGTGGAKVAGNYAASMLPGHLAKMNGYSDVVYLDPIEHKYIEELGAANFYGITEDGQLQTPLSPSILPSITKYSVLELAKEFNLTPTETQINIEDIDKFVEAGAMGTAAVITPVGSITHNNEKHVLFSETEVGPLTRKLYNRLTSLQCGDSEDSYGWTVDVPLN